MPYVKAWAEKYGPGLAVVGAHSPEFAFEHDPENIRSALAAMGIGYPVAVDNDFAIWRAFDNAYWPALYVADAQGRLRYHHFGEEAYERSERVIRQLLTEAGHDVDPDLVGVEADGVYLAADWTRLGSPETYVGYARAAGFASPGGFALDRSRVYPEPERLRLNHWSLSGAWTAGRQVTVLDEPGGRITHRFRGRDVNLVMGGRADGGPVRYRVALDGEPPRGARGLDVGEDGSGIAERGAAPPADPAGRGDPRADRRDHLRRRRRPRLRVHVRLGARSPAGGRTSDAPPRNDPGHRRAGVGSGSRPRGPASVLRAPAIRASPCPRPRRSPVVAAGSCRAMGRPPPGRSPVVNRHLPGMWCR